MSEPKIVYQTDYTGDGRFVGPVQCDPDPMEKARWLIPAGAVEIAPPEAVEPTYARWTGDAWEVVTPAEPEPEPEPERVPLVLSMRQAKLQLSRAGLLNDANTAIGTMTGQAGEEARIEWEYATELRRDHPLVAGIGSALKLTSKQIDALFVEAAKIA